MDNSNARKWRKDYSPPAFLVSEVELAFDIQRDYVEVRCRLEMLRNPQGDAQQPCVLNGKQLQLQWLEVDGRRLEPTQYHYQQQDGLLTLAQVPDRFTLSSCVWIDPYRNKALSGFYLSGEVLCSQNEAEGFRCITFFPDRPDVMSRYSCQISADKARYPVLLSNGNLLEKKELGQGRHWVKWQDPFPKPCYLFAIVAGNLERIDDHFTTASGRPVKLEIYTDLGRSHLAHFAMEALKKSMAWDEREFGREYDLDLFMIVAVDSFNFGAMENKGLNIFNSRLVYADPTVATDADFKAVERVIAHEYFHNWTGNRITCRDWFQLTLKEGLTVYRDEEFSAEQTDPTIKRVEDVNFLRQVQYPEDAGATRHPIRPDSYIQIENFYTPTIYRKGAAVIRMMAEYVGRKKFRLGMDLYFQRFDGMAICCDDFIDAIEQGSGVDLSSFRHWYSQPGTPRVKVLLRMEAEQAVLTLSQSNPNAGEQAVPLGIPFPLALYHSSGRLLVQQTPLLRSAAAELCFAGIKEKPIPSLLAGHISPVIVDYDYQDAELLLLLMHDHDPFNRYEAGQRLFSRFILQLCVQPDFVPPAQLWQALTTILNDESLSPDYRALLLSLPSLRELAGKQQVPQFQLLRQQRLHFARLLAQALDAPCRKWHLALRDSDPAYSPQLAARRSLRATTAHLLALLGERSLVDDYYRHAVNMTEALEGLRLLCHYFPGEEVEDQLQQFRQRWQGDVLVLCKWLAVQSSAPEPQTVERVTQLAQDPIFRGDMPNMVRALYGGLAANLPVFHRADGAGYRLLADEVLRVDAFNQLTASSLAKQFFDFSRLGQPQKNLMRCELERLLSCAGLSNCSREPLSAIYQEGRKEG